MPKLWTRNLQEMSELELDIRWKEVVMNFRRWCARKGIDVFSSDTFRVFLKEKKWVNRFVDQEENVNVGAILHVMLKAKNPLHQIRKVGWTRSTIETNKNRAIRLYKFTQ